MYKGMSSANSFTSFFSIWMPLVSFCCFITLAKTSSTMLSRSAKVDIFVLFLTLEMLSAFHIEYDVRCGLVLYIHRQYILSIMLDVACIYSFVEVHSFYT